MSLKEKKQAGLFSPIVIVAALGYFVDIYDLLLFSIVRVPSLQDLGFKDQEMLESGLILLDLQMFGMLIGGIFWGILGDKKGRLSVLFGSILMYSLANLANGFVTDIYQYAALRVIAGIGLAGELGVGITLVTEVMPKETRGYGTTLVASVGIIGAVFAGVVADIFDWRTCYIIGGSLGLCLLALRIGVSESGMFEAVKEDNSVNKGDFLALFKSSKTFWKYMRFILIGLPIWFTVGILITLSPEFGTALNVTDPIQAGKAVMFCYGGLALGDLLSGMLSQVLKSRVKVLYIFWALTAMAVVTFFVSHNISGYTFYLICFFLGLANGSWVVFMTASAEQFGTNIRATVTTTIPNFVRGSVIPLTILFTSLKSVFGVLGAGAITGSIALTAAFFSIRKLKETFGQSMEFNEEL